MDFKELMNKIENFGKNELIYWSNAIAGEAGELCNIVKKIYRDNLNLEDNTDAMGKELADIFIYVALTARDILKIDLEQAILQKLEIVKQRRQPPCKFFIPEENGCRWSSGYCEGFETCWEPPESNKKGP